MSDTTTDPLAVPTRHAQAKAAHGAKLWTWIARGTVLALLASVVAGGGYLAVANAGARAERVELIQQLDEERAKVDALHEQLRDLGEDPIVDKSDPKPGAQGPSGPTGEQGIPGQDGRTPTAAEVLAAVNTYCATVNGCRGADGVSGLDGMNGISVTGVSRVVLDDLSTAFRFTFSDGEAVDVRGACLP